MSIKKSGNAIRLYVFVDTVHRISERPLVVIIGKSKTIRDLRKEFSEQKYYLAEEQHWVMNGRYCFDEFEIKSIIKTMTPYENGFVAFLFMMSVEYKNRLPECFAIFAEGRYRDVKPADRWHKPEQELMIISEVVDNTKPGPVVGWNCTQCTYLNEPYLEYCDICNICRLRDFKMPDTYYYTKKDEHRMDKEKEKEERQNKIKAELENKSEQVKNSHVEKLRQISKEKLVLSTSSVQCPICKVSYGPGETIVLRNCLDTICKKCLKKHVTTSKDPKVKCFNGNCKGYLEDQEIQGILNDEEYERYQQLGLRTAERKIRNTYHCKTPNCSYFVIIDYGSNEFLCPRCHKTNCILCGAIHARGACNKYKEETRVQRTLEIAKYFAFGVGVVMAFFIWQTFT